MGVNGSTPTPQVTLTLQVERKVLFERLEAAARRRVCLVIGAAGWGKSTAVESWARRSPTAWVRNEDHGGDGRRFARCLCAALSPHVNAPPPTPLEPDSVQDGVLRGAAAIRNWLRGSLLDDLCLVIDDVHELPPDGDAVRLVADLCQYAPDQLHLVLISRSELPFSLARLQGQGMVAEIQAPELAFDVTEVGTLLWSSVGEHPPDLAALVYERTGGWPAVTCRAVEMMRRVPSGRRAAVLDKLTHPGERLHGYLVEEVLGAEPPQVRDLLGRLAVFGEVTATSPLVSGTGETASMLAELTRRGLVQHIPGHVDHWSLVRPLRDYFDHKAALAPGDRARLHRLAADECAGRGAHTEALHHLLAAGEHATCAAMLVEHGAMMVNSGRSDAVLAALEMPAEYLADARIQTVIGQARQMTGHWAAALECFRRADDRQDELSPALAWRVGLIAYEQGEFAEVLAVRRRTRFALEDTPDEVRMLVLASCAHRMVGDLAACRAATKQVTAAARRCPDASARAAADTALALLAGAEGDRSRADSYFLSALRTADAAGDVPQALRIRVLRAVHLLELGLPRDGATEAQAALRIAEEIGDSYLIAQALAARGRAYVRLGKLGQALSDLSNARDRLQSIGSRFLAWPLSGIGDVYRMLGQPARARAAYEGALAQVEPSHDVLGISVALTGLARIRAADDIEVARELAEQAVGLGDGLRYVEARLTRGWVALLGGDREAATADAVSAATEARSRRDDPGLAEALTLGALSSPDPTRRHAPIAEAIEIWHESGCRVEEAVGRVVAHRLRAPLPDTGAELAEGILRDSGVEFESRRPAGPLAALEHLTPSLAIRSLGIFQVLRDGVPLPRGAWQSRKARDLLKILVARRRPVSRDQLMELLWPDADPGKSGGRLSVALSTLREVLQPSARAVDGVPLIADSNMVSLDHGTITIDVENFLAYGDAALDADRLGKDDATARLLAAEAAHTGDFMEEDLYQEWAAPLADEVRATYIAVLRALVSRLGAEGDVDGVVRYTLRLLGQDSYDEQAHLDLVRTQLSAGHHGEAQRRYRIYVRQMTELGVEPRPFPG